MEFLNLFDYAAQARALLEPMVRDYYASGAHDELTLRRNQEAFRRLQLRPRVLVDVSERDMELELQGESLSMPILVAPMAFQGMATPEAELATVRAAGRHGTIMVLSTLSNVPMEDVVAAASAPVWFQLYVYRDRAISQMLVERAEAAGCKALVLTIDAPVVGQRESDVRNGFRLPEGLKIANILPVGDKSMDQLDGFEGQSGLAAYFRELLEPGLTWKDIAWLRSITRLPIWLKGVLRADDALRAHDHGASGVIVSNHGGRQLDTAISTIEALPAIAEAVGDKLDILLDGGIRRGTDILKALAHGAKAVLVGRPILWGLATRGEEGAHHVLQLLRDELDLAMALSGCPSLHTITPDLLHPS